MVRGFCFVNLPRALPLRPKQLSFSEVAAGSSLAAVSLTIVDMNTLHIKFIY